MRCFTVIALIVGFLGTANCSAPPALAQAPSAGAASATTNGSGQAPLWEIHLHMQRSFASPIGQHLLAKFKSEKPGKYEDFIKFVEAIGLDPRFDIGEVVVFGNGFENHDATLIVDIGSSTGNLEGWVLAAPGYESEDLDENTLLHSILLEDKNVRAYFAMPKHEATGDYVLVGSLDQEHTIGLARRVLDGKSSPIPNPLEGKSLLKFFVSDLSKVPMEINENDPGSAIVKTIEQIGLNIASDSDNLSVNMELTASSAGKARQVSQLLLGLKAMVQLAPMEEAEAKKLATLLESVNIHHAEGEPKVRANLVAPYQLLEELARELEAKKRAHAQSLGKKRSF